MVAHQPGDAVGLVLALGDRRVARALRLGDRQRNVGRLQHQARRRVGLAALDLVVGQLAVADRVDALDPLGDLAVGDRLDLERVQAAELGDLVEGEPGVLHQPHRGGLGHEGQRHGFSPHRQALVADGDALSGVNIGCSDRADKGPTDRSGPVNSRAQVTEPG